MSDSSVQWMKAMQVKKNNCYIVLASHVVHTLDLLWVHKNQIGVLVEAYVAHSDPNSKFTVTIQRDGLPTVTRSARILASGSSEERSGTEPSESAVLTSFLKIN